VASPEPEGHLSFPPYPDAASAEKVFAEHVGPSMVRLMRALGTQMHLGRREGPRVEDAYTGKWYWDCHRNGTLYNLGHRHPKVLAALRDALHQLEVGNLFLASGYKARAAEYLAASSDGELPGITWAASGAEANEVAIRAARGFTRRRKFVCLQGGYHGSTCFTMAAGDNTEFRERYLLDFPEFVRIPYNDVEAMRAAVDNDTAAVLMEPTPAQLGFPEPAPGYLETVRDVCDQHGALLVFDEVQTGLGATGHFWMWQTAQVRPDIVTTAKGLGGGIVPNAAVLMSRKLRDWFVETPFPHSSTFGGNELGCIATQVVVQETMDPAFVANTGRLIEQFAEGLRDAPFTVSQNGLCMGLTSTTLDNVAMTRRLFDAGILVVPAEYAPNTIEFRPVLVLNETEAETIISGVRDALT